MLSLFDALKQGSSTGNSVANPDHPLTVAKTVPWLIVGL
jgi:hypothetical protein